MLRLKRVLHVLAATLVLVVVADVEKAASQFDPCRFAVVANPGVVTVCPKGDGDPLTAAIGGGNSQITLTITTNGGVPVPGIPAEDMWLVGCSNGLLLCGLSSGSNADDPTNAQGQTTFSNEPAAGGCDTGLYVVVQGIIAQDPNDACHPLCVPIATRSPDYKSAGAPGPPPCAADIRCPDSRVTNADFSWFVTHYPTAANPGAPYFACADFAAPLGAIGLADFSKFSIHFFAQVGHKCPI
jgi:hypothetical protein